MYLLTLWTHVNGLIFGCYPRKEFPIFSPLGCQRDPITGRSNGPTNGRIGCLLDVDCCIMVLMKESASFFTSFKIFAAHTFTVFRTQNTGLEALAVLLEAPRFLAVASFAVLSHHLNFCWIILEFFLRHNQCNDNYN